MSGVVAEIKNKALSVNDINEFLAKLADTGIEKEKYEAELSEKSYIPIEWLALLKNYVIVPRNKLVSLRDASMKADEKLGIESLATHILVDLLDGKLGEPKP